MTNTIDFTSIGWRASQLHLAIKALARKAGLLSEWPERLSGYHGPADNDLIEQWMLATTQQIGIESEAVEIAYAEFEQQLHLIGPALIRLPGDSPRFLAVLKGSKKGIKVITPNDTVRYVHPTQLREVLASDLEAPIAPTIATLLTDAGVASQRQAAVKTAILREQLKTVPIGGCWLLRLSPGDDFLKQLRHARLPHQLLLILGVNLIGQVFMLLEWWLIGESALSGHFHWAFLSAWALLLLTAIPVQLLGVWIENTLSLNLASLFKQRLLYGILQLEPDEIRHQGSGQFLGLVMETASLESLALGGGLTTLVAVLELCIALGVLAIGTGGLVHVLLLVGWLALTGSLCWYNYLKQREWVTLYREMSNDLVERMIGHRTRLAQEKPSHWHDEEDAFLERYLHSSERVDRLNVAIKAIIGRGWLVVGLLGIVYSVIVAPVTTTALAISLGGILLASQALTRFVMGISSFSNVMITWQQVAPLFHAAARDQKRQSSQIILPAEIKRKQPVLTAQDLSFRYRADATPILEAEHLKIHQGERLLLKGPSGSGKSALAALLAGMRQPDSGELCLWGIEQGKLGLDSWRKKIVIAPQFHENHVFTETFVFNLLMGRRWPPLRADLEKAEIICRELGLGDLLERMPAGFQQMVGESGWQLSHGERSRLYIARAILQEADLIILDESFAALDPENLKRALQCVFHHAPTLLVIAHP
ncbi:MAG: ABC transporter ATP-binding protein [Candidatus Parabeggiatoa sp. nov. 3]|nr:MAG: ABC transporter ATP-binding protein [Gammaproteobacteria bacterium]RKZ61581.1 MAG: ABC transporter ATP-binding protein [Gammaproteobacteria bacterium]RKZ82917.1 MAG: ABC transporter ATP-binding protein [Gammaproteobacteria bacterium]HEW97896.1 ABC transporter ATP-binding protein [Beggiatoa sp.]